MLYASRIFELSQTDDKGITLAEHLSQVGVDLDLPNLPYLLEPTWSKFIELSNTRSMGIDGPMPISYLEIKAWSELTGNKLSYFEVSLIKKIDSEFIKANHGSNGI